MRNAKKDLNKRCYERLDRSLQISLLDQTGKTVNISSSGVYLEIVTDDIQSFTPDTKLPILINAATTIPGRKGKRIRLEGEAVVVRSDIKDVTSRGSKLGIALKFKKRLEIVEEHLDSTTKTITGLDRIVNGVSRIANEIRQSLKR